MTQPFPEDALETNPLLSGLADDLAIALPYLKPVEIAHAAQRVRLGVLRAINRGKADGWDEAAAWVDENDPGWGEQIRDANPYRRDGEGR